jgi:hypothetical protein
MTTRRLGGNDECKDGWTCPGVWEEHVGAADVVVVGELLDPSPVPLGAGEVAVRIPRAVLRDADLA